MIVKYTEEEFKNAKSYDLLDLECECCHKSFKAQKKAIKHELTHNKGRLKYCSVKCFADSHNKKHIVNCECCGKEIEVNNSSYRNSKSKHFFCNSSCAAKYNNTKRGSRSYETKKKISESLRRYYYDSFDSRNKETKKGEPKNKTRKKYYSSSRFLKRVCRICGKTYTLQNSGSTRTFCSKDCLGEYRQNVRKYLSDDAIKKLSSAGRHSMSIQSENRRSKNEKYFCELCEKHFKDVKHNEPIFNGWDADVIIEDAKIGVLWNGKWHYEKITEKHSLLQTQNRDKIKLKEIKNCGYTPYVIKDMGKYNPSFVEQEFRKFLKRIKAEEWNV